MKKSIWIIGFAVFFAACSTEQETASMSGTSSNQAMTTRKCTPAEGDAMYKNGELYVMENKQWLEVEDTVYFKNGMTVYPDGKVVKDGKTIQLDDGASVDNDGNLFDHAGNALKDDWQGIKKGAGEVKMFSPEITNTHISKLRREKGNLPDWIVEARSGFALPRFFF